MLRPFLLSIAILGALYAACEALYIQRHPSETNQAADHARSAAFLFQEGDSGTNHQPDQTGGQENEWRPHLASGGRSNFLNDRGPP